jgi:hypothetical protein
MAGHAARPQPGGMTVRAGLALAALLVGVATVGCSSSHPATCANNSCQPAIMLQYRTPIDGDYEIRILLNAVVYDANCPRGPSGPGVSSDAAVIEITCDANGATLTGVDLGNGENQTLDLIVQLGSGPAAIEYMVTANLSSISNSRDCSLVCFQHAGTVGN